VDSSGNAFTPDGKIKVDLREVQTSSGAYSWRAHTAAPTNPSLRLQQFNDLQAAFLKNGEFTDFMALPTPLRLFVHQFSGRALNMNEAVQRAMPDSVLFLTFGVVSPISSRE
jgi:hypothetical protein